MRSSARRDGRWNVAEVLKPGPADKPVPTFVVSRGARCGSPTAPRGGCPRPPSPTCKGRPQRPAAGPDRAGHGRSKPFGPVHLRGRLNRINRHLNLSVELAEFPVGPAAVDAARRFAPELAPHLAKLTAVANVKAEFNYAPEASPQFRHDVRFDVKGARFAHRTCPGRSRASRPPCGAPTGGCGWTTPPPRSARPSSRCRWRPGPSRRGPGAGPRRPAGQAGGAAPEARRGRHRGAPERRPVRQDARQGEEGPAHVQPDRARRPDVQVRPGTGPAGSASWRAARGRPGPCTKSSGTRWPTSEGGSAAPPPTWHREHRRRPDRHRRGATADRQGAPGRGRSGPGDQPAGDGHQRAPGTKLLRRPAAQVRGPGCASSGPPAGATSWPRSPRRPWVT